MSSGHQAINLHASRSHEITVPAILCPALALVAVVLRLITRFFITKAPSVDDAFTVFALIFSIGNSICQVLGMHNGFGRHIASLTPAQITGCLQALYASIILYNLALTSIKVSIILLYMRLFSCRVSAMRICYALLVIMAGYGIETLFFGIFTCYPIESYWNPKIHGSKCFDRARLYYANAGISIITDLALLVIPIIYLHRLTMRTVQKIIVTIIVAFGGLACLASILRLRTLYMSTSSKDVTWDKTPTIYWSTIEINIGIICASVPTLRALATRLFPRAFSYRQQVQTSAVVNAGMGRIGDVESKGKPKLSTMSCEDSSSAGDVSGSRQSSNGHLWGKA